MSPRAPRLAAAVLLCLLPLGSLSACGGGESQAEPPPLSLTPSPSPTSAAPTVAPPGETAREFIYRWFELEKLMENDGDTRAYRAVTRACEPCRQTADFVEGLYAAGGHITSRPSQVLSISPIPADQGYFAARVRVRIFPSTYVETASAKTERFPGGLRTYKVILTHRDGWSIANFTKLAL